MLHLATVEPATLALLRRLQHLPVDLARLMDDYDLPELFRYYLAKYPDATPALAIRSLAYFADAEAMPMPKMLIPFNWESAKQKISSAVRKLVVDGF